MPIDTDSPVITARVLMDPLDDLPELMDDWRQEINALINAELHRVPVRGELGCGCHYEDRWFLPEHTLRLDVTATFVPFEVRGVLVVSGQTIPWTASLDLDASHESPAWMRKRVCVFTVVQGEL